MRYQVLLASFLSMLLQAACPSARAEGERPDAQQILTRMEATINGFADQVMEVGLTIVDVDGSKKSYEFTVYQKGDAKRMIRFTSGEFKGMATLVEDRSHIYVYLPGFKKVRRVAAHNMNQSFAGSDFSNEDMSNVSWTKIYDAKIEREDEGSWYLDCRPKPAEKSEYARALVKVDKKTFVQLGVEYFNQAGEKVKVFANSNPKDFPGGGLRNSQVEVSDPRTGHRTLLEVKSFKTNQKLEDALFTVRQLEWGN